MGNRKTGVSRPLCRSSRIRAQTIMITSSVFRQDDVIATVTQYFPDNVYNMVARNGSLRTSTEGDDVSDSTHVDEAVAYTVIEKDI